MTTGQRIAAKRKELELSQEGLGEALGVSRQSIYKWESDASLPEIDKLVALSRLFQVSVGWLLGVEENAPEAPAGDGQLSEAQLHMVEEILSRYQQTSAQRLSQEQQEQVEALVAGRLSASPPPVQKKWPVRLLFVVCAIMAVTIFSINDKADQAARQYNDLANSIANVNSSVNRQIGSITNRVEEVLKAQNSLTADYGVELTDISVADNTAAFSARVVPKTYVPGMEVVFLVDSGDGPVEIAAQPQPGQAFTGALTCPLTDSITLSAVFITGDTRQTQLLDSFGGLYQSTLPEVDPLEAHGLWGLLPQEDGAYLIEDLYSAIRWNASPPYGDARVEQARIGLFKNQALVAWLEPCDKPENYGGYEDSSHWAVLPRLSLALEEGDHVDLVVIYTDQYGRQGAAPAIPRCQVEDGRLNMAGGDVSALYSLDNWEF